MMGYDDFYLISEYGNENWKGYFSHKEVACNAYDYLCEFQVSKKNKNPTHTIKTLMEHLAEDNTIEANFWLGMMKRELGMTL